MKKYKNYIIALLVIMTILTVVCFVPISVTKLIPVVEKQVAADLGVDIHLEHLVLRIGPKLKLKTPIVHLMYEDGQKFAQIDSAKLYIPWSSVIKKHPSVQTLQAKNITIRVSSDDKFLPKVIDKVLNKDFSELPNVNLKEYKILYYDKPNNQTYRLSGQELDLNKQLNHKNYKINSKGYLGIDNKEYINYDISISPKFNITKESVKFDFEDILNKIKQLDYHSDVIADLKLYKNQNEETEASGFINIDNISVLENIEKTPKSFVYVTLWGDKASILSNIYTSATQKVYLEGMINNSKKPVLDLKVKTDDIELSSLFKKLKIFADLSKFKSITSVNGIMSANFTLKGDLNKLKSNGYMKIKDAELKTNGLKIEKINSDIDFSNNKIDITNAIGYVNQAPIMLKGSVDKEVNLELLMSNVELKHLLPESYGIKKGIISLSGNVTGKLDSLVHKENIKIENFMAEKEGNSLSLDSLKIDTNRNNTAYINNVNLSTKHTPNIKIPSMRLQVERESITLPETAIYMPNSKVTVKGNAANYNNKNMSFSLIADGFINSSDIKTISSPSTKYPVKMNISGSKLTQNINGQMLIEKTDILDEPAILNLNAKLSKEKNSDKIGLKIDDIGIIGFSGKFSNDFKQNIKGQKKISVNGQIEDIANPVFKNLRIYTPQLLNIQLPDNVVQFKSDLFVNGEYKKPEIVGQLFIQNLFNQASQTTISNCAIDFNKNTASINAPFVKIADSSIGINAVAIIDFAKALTFKTLNIKSKYLNTDTVLMYKDAPMLKQFPVTVNEGHFYSERVLSEMYGSPVYLTAFSSDFKLKNDILALKNISAELFNGKLAGSVNFNLKDETYGTNVMARTVSAAPIFDIISPSKDTISGTMDFDANLKGNLISKNSINGDIKFIVHNGRMSTLGKLEHLLYAQNVIADSMLRTSLSVVMKAITLKDTGLFKYLRADIAINNGVADIKMLQSLGPLMSLYIKGQYYPENDSAKLTILGRISDEIVSGLGAFGDFSFKKLMIMLTGEDNKYNIRMADIENLPQLPIKNTKEFRSIINGPVDKPSSVQSFNWISYTQKSLRQKEVPMTDVKMPSFVDELPY